LGVAATSNHMISPRPHLILAAAWPKVRAITTLVSPVLSSTRTHPLGPLPAMVYTSTQVSMPRTPIAAERFRLRRTPAAVSNNPLGL
jgi:hypothetical protein